MAAALARLAAALARTAVAPRESRVLVAVEGRAPVARTAGQEESREEAEAVREAGEAGKEAAEAGKEAAAARGPT